MTKMLQTPPGYAALLKDIKERVRTAQVRASLAVNRELVLLYWSIGRDILDRQKVEGWGTKVIERLAKDLGTEFPGIEGFSQRNLKGDFRPQQNSVGCRTQFSGDGKSFLHVCDLAFYCCRSDCFSF